MGSFTATLLDALLSAGVSRERAMAVVEQLDRAIDERFSLHAQVLATKRDVAELQAAVTERIADTNERIARTNERIAALDGSLSARIAALDGSVSARIAALDGSVSARIAETRAELVKWMLGALTAQTALILGALKLF